MRELPPDSRVGEMILADLTGDFSDRIFRLKTLLAFDADYAEAYVILPGGQASHMAYVEARASFVVGNFMATILLSQSLVENLLGGHVIIDDVAREVRRRPSRSSARLSKRPSLRALIDHALEAGIIVETDIDDIERLMALRNPLVHFRDVNDPDNLTRRAMERGVHPNQIMFEDARFAMGTIIRIVGQTHRAFGRFDE